jgi:hypothetical protein
MVGGRARRQLAPERMQRRPCAGAKVALLHTTLLGRQLPQMDRLLCRLLNASPENKIRARDARVTWHQRAEWLAEPKGKNALCLSRSQSVAPAREGAPSHHVPRGRGSRFEDGGS